MGIKSNKDFESEMISNMMDYLGSDRAAVLDTGIKKAASMEVLAITDTIAELVSIAEALEDRGSDLVGEVDVVLDIFDTDF